MNQRIKELLNEVGIYQLERFNGIDGSNQLEKFAELIVRECATTAEKEQALNARYSDASKHPQVNIGQCILMEFGL